MSVELVVSAEKDSEFLVRLSTGNRLIINPSYYMGIGPLGLMPDDISLSEDPEGIDKTVRREFGNIRGSCGSLIRFPAALDMDMLLMLKRGGKDYVLRGSEPEGGRVFALYPLVQATESDERLAMAFTSSGYNPKIYDIAVPEDLRRQGYATILLYGVEIALSRQSILCCSDADGIKGFLAKRGYRLLANNFEMAKALNPDFDTALLMPRDQIDPY